MASLFSTQTLYRWVIDWVLARAIGPYIEGPLNVDSSKSPIELKNLFLKRDIIERLSNDIPLTIEEGLIGKISLKLPNLSSFIFSSNDPIEIEIEDIVILFNGQNFVGMNTEYERKRETAIQEHKVKLLESLEEEFKGINQENKSWFSSVSTRAYDIAARILQSLQFNFKNLHFRMIVDNKYASGIRIGELVCRNTNENWSPIDSKASNIIDSFKLLEMKDLSVYWHNFSPEKDGQFLENLNPNLKNLTYEKQEQEVGKISRYFESLEFQNSYIIEPVYAQCRILKRMSKLVLVENARIESSFLFTKIRLTLDAQQYKEILKVADYLSMLQKRKKYAKNRPENEPNRRKNYKNWWKWAFYHLSAKKRKIREQNEKIYEKILENNQYVKYYRIKLDQTQSQQHKSIRPILKQIENKRSLSELTILRKAVYATQINANHDNSNFEDLDLSNIEVITTDKDDTFLKVCCTIQNGELGIKIKNQQNDRKEHLVEFKNMIISGQHKPKSKSKVVNLSLEDVYLKNIFDFNDYKDSNTNNGKLFPKSGIEEILNHLDSHKDDFRSLHSSSQSNTTSILQVSYTSFEKYSSVNYAMLPMKIYYDKHVVNEIKSFFKSKNLPSNYSFHQNNEGPEQNFSHLLQDLGDTNEEDLKYNFTQILKEKQKQLKEQAKNQLMNKWRQLTEGSGPKTFGSIFGSSKHLTLSIKIIAPHIVLPCQNIELHLDLGYWKIENSARAEDGLSINSSEFLTPEETFEDAESELIEDVAINSDNVMMVPQNIAKTNSQKRPSKDTDTSHSNNPQQHYDIYHLTISDFQLAIGSKSDNWLDILNKGHGPNHILNSFCFNLEVKRQIVLSYTDSAWLEVQGNLTEFIINISSKQAKNINLCLKELESEESKQMKEMRKNLVASGQLTQSKQAYNELEEKERKKLDKIKEQRQLLCDFTITKIIINLTDDTAMPICAIQLENLKWQLVKKPLSGSAIFSLTTFILVDHKASQLGDDYHFIISANNKVGIDVGSGKLIDSGARTPGVMSSSFHAGAPGEEVLTHALNKLHDYKRPLINTEINWFHSSSPDIQDKPVGVSYQTVDVEFSSFDIVFQPISWASTASTVDKIMKALVGQSSKPPETKKPKLSSKSREISITELQPDEDTQAKPWHTTFTLEINTIHMLFTRILKRGPFKNSAQKIVSMKIDNTHTTVIMDQNSNINWSSKIKSIVAYDLTNSNLSAQERNRNLADSFNIKTDRNPYKPARIFTIGKVEKYQKNAENFNHAFHYIYPDDGVSERQHLHDKSDCHALNLEISKDKKSQSLKIVIGDINYVHSSRFITEFLDSLDQFDEQWNEQVSASSRDLLKSSMANSMRRVATNMGMEAAFFNPDEEGLDDILEEEEEAYEIPEETPKVSLRRTPSAQAKPETKALIEMTISAPLLALPMTGLPDRLHPGNNYFMMFCPGKMRLENMDNLKSKDELALFSLSLTTLNVYSLIIKKDQNLADPIIMPKVQVIENTDVKLKISRFNYVSPTGRDYIKNNQTCEQGQVGLKVVGAFANPIEVAFMKSTFEQLLRTLDNIMYPTDIDVVYGQDSLKASPKEEHQKPVKSESPAHPSSFKKHTPMKAMIKIPINLQLYQDLGDNQVVRVARIKLPKIVVNFNKELFYHASVDLKIYKLQIIDEIEFNENPTSSNSVLLETLPELKIFKKKAKSFSGTGEDFANSFINETNYNLKKSKSVDEINNLQLQNSVPLEKKSSAIKNFDATDPDFFQRKSDLDEFTPLFQAVSNSNEAELIEVKMTMIDGKSQEYTTVYNRWNREMSVALKNIQARLNLRTFITLLDFFSIGTEQEIMKQRSKFEETTGLVRAK